ncbi:MAG: site-2 protease family protein [bacterium]|nr:site-2 protease family protein [bacterium]MDZ4295998.1 site-2 protease family protein [Patescibacteria group bacterium]
MDLRFLLFLYVIVISSAIVHEYAHAWMADRLGDPTARLAGRLTLNPAAHIDLFGTVLLPLILLFFASTFIGWAKPVPFNPYNLSDQRWGTLKVGLAGPAANFLLAAVLAVIFRVLSGSDIGGIDARQLALFLGILGWIIYINISLGLFNLIPVPPLDGSKVIPELLPFRWRGIFEQSFAGIAIALVVAFFFLPVVANSVFFVFTGESFR